MNVAKIVFVDESGDEGRSEGSSDYYVILALIVEGDDYREILQHFKGVRARRFSGGSEMKSDTVGNNSVRRKQIITDITSKPFDLSILVVDKQKLTSTGFNYPHSFIKYLNGRLYQNIATDFNFVQVKADVVKSRTFTNELKQYLERKNPKTLFSECRFEFINSCDNECIQACDFLGGTIRRCIEGRETNENKGVYWSHIKERSYVEIFPYIDHQYLYEITEKDKSDYDTQIEKKAVEEAYRFINTQESHADSEILMGIHCLQLLLSDYFINNGDRWISAYTLETKLGDMFNENIGDQKLRSIIGKLRDNNVLIASKRSGGYKIPTCINDLYEYLNAQNMTIAPMIGRIRKAADLVRRATNGNVNILEIPAYRNLKQLVEAIPQLET